MYNIFGNSTGRLAWAFHIYLDLTWVVGPLISPPPSRNKLFIIRVSLW